MQTLNISKAAVLLVLLAISSFAVGASFGTFQRFAIDDFTIGENNLLITIPAGAVFPITQFSAFTDSGNNGNKLLGGERDLTLAAEAGPANRVLTSNVGGGEWLVATPGGARGFALMQYDGKDNSDNLDPNGLGGLDFTVDGLGEAFTAVIETDVATVYTFTVTSPNGNQCTVDQTIPGTQAPSNYYIPFSTFTGNCDFQNVGAVDILIEQFEDVDSLITLFAVVGQEDPTASRTPSPNPSVQLPSPSRTPSPGVSTIPAVCVCECPSFRCGVVYKQKDDDDDSVDDDTHDDDDLVYRAVYYGPVDDDFDDITGDDDEDEFMSWMGGLTDTGIHDDDDLFPFESVNSAQTLTVSVALFFVIATFVL